MLVTRKQTSVEKYTSGSEHSSINCGAVGSLLSATQKRKKKKERKRERERWGERKASSREGGRGEGEERKRKKENKCWLWRMTDTCLGECKVVQPIWKSVQNFLNKLIKELPQITVSVCRDTDWHAVALTYTCMHPVVLFTRAKFWN